MTQPLPSDIHPTLQPAPSSTQPTNVLPLSMVAPGETVELVKICENCKLRRRLVDLGMNVGSCIRVMQSDPNAPVLLAITCDSRLAVGRSTAHRILVRYPDCERG